MIRKMAIPALGLTVLFFFIETAAGQYAFQVEPNHSTIGFALPIADGFTKVTGKFTDFQVAITYDERNLQNSSVKAVIKVNSIDTGIDLRDKDLCGPEFFDAEKHLEIIFESKRIERRGEDFVAVGDFSMRGIKKEIALPFRITGIRQEPDRKAVLGISSRSKLNRQLYGVGAGWKHSLIENFLGDEMEIEIDLWTRPASKR